MKLHGVTKFEANTPAGAADRRDLLAAGVKRFSLVQGREAIADMFTDPRALSKGDVIQITDYDCLDETAELREKRVARAAELGVFVKVGSDHPKIYGSAESRAEFRAASVTAQRRRDGLTGVLRSPGRPHKFPPPDEPVFSVLREMWQNKNVPFSDIQLVADREGVRYGADLRARCKTWYTPERQRPAGEEPLEVGDG